MKKRIIASVLTACTLVSMTACSANQTVYTISDTSDTQLESTDASITSAEGNADISVSDKTAGFPYSGTYYGDRCCIVLEAGDQNKVNIKVSWGSSYNQCTEWTMTGDYDKEANLITYTDGVKKEVKYADQKTVEKEDTVYSDGEGTLIFNPTGESFTWTDKKENAAEGLIFKIYTEESGNTATATSDADSDENYYIAFSAMSKAGIEENADKIRKLYLAEDWEGMKTMIRYPVMINGAEVENEEEFLKVMKGKKVSADSRKAMEEETCKNMFYNGQGLCMGSGQVWLLDPSYMTDNTPEIKIRTIQGLE